MGVTFHARRRSKTSRIRPTLPRTAQFSREIVVCALAFLIASCAHAVVERFQRKQARVLVRSIS